MTTTRLVNFLIILCFWSGVSFAIPDFAFSYRQNSRPSIGRAPTLQEQTIIVAVDWSQSMDQMDPPHQVAASINHFIDVSRLSTGRIKLVFVFFHGQTVEVISGPDGLAAVGSEDMRRRCHEYLSKPCSGATPLDGALEAVNKVLANSVSKNKTLIIISDGEPTTSLRPEIFCPV